MDVSLVLPILFGITIIFVFGLIHRLIFLKEDLRVLERKSQRFEKLYYKTIDEIEVERFQKGQIQAELDKLKSQKSKNSYEVDELLNDLTKGKALVEIKRVAPENFFLRSPRDVL